MWRSGAIILAALLVATGCKSTSGEKSTDREPFGSGVARNKSKDSKDGKDAKGNGQTWLNPAAKLPGGDTGVPRAGGGTSNPSNPSFDPKTESQDMVSGKVVDAFNRPAKNVFIRVASANDPPGAAALGIQTDNSGYFFTRGLKPGVAYNLTAEATQDGKQFTGTVQTRVPNPVITIVLREDNGVKPDGLSGGPPVGGASGAFPPPPAPSDGDNIPPMGLGAGNPPRTNLPRTDGAYSPDSGASRPVPPSIGGSPTPIPGAPKPKTNGTLPEPDDLTMPGKPTRPENVAGSPNPFAPPVTSVPGIPNLPAYPVPPVTPPGGGGGVPDPKQSRVRPGANFALVDTFSRQWDFATSRSSKVVLLEFVTTTCQFCKPVVPVLKGFQSQYGADGLEVIAVLCDDTTESARVEAAKKYATASGVNYAVYVEPGASPGAVRDKLGVQSYPHAVLLDATGAVLWKGHPTLGGNKADLEAAIKRATGK